MDLLISCLSYLCYDAVCQDADEVQIRENLVSGKYRFLTFASSAWIDLVKQYVRITRQGRTFGALNELLENMLSELKNPMFQPGIDDDADAGQAADQHSRLLWPGAPSFIAHSLRFYQGPDDIWTVDNGKISSRW